MNKNSSEEPGIGCILYSIVLVSIVGAMSRFGNVCTFFATGTQSAFQPIFTCKTCCTEAQCICEDCSEICHRLQGHEIDFVGVGPCYCDCSKVSRPKSCHLQEISKEAATYLGICSLSNHQGLNLTLPPTSEINHTDFPFSYGSFIIPTLRGNKQTRMNLITEALELVRHSTDTHWVPANHDSNTWTHLELLAQRIFQKHVSDFHLSEHLGNESGAEWWVQVKDLHNQAIDLHYDKDEELANVFSLASFPTLSTVTYLTGGDVTNDLFGTCHLPTSPTIIFAHTYEMPTDDGEMCISDSLVNSMPQVFLSQPRTGKHIVFDGRLLHGAPSDPSLRESPNDQAETKSNTDPLSQVRITFLVNIWLTKRPNKVSILSSTIRQDVINSSKRKGCGYEEDRLSMPIIEFEQQSVQRLDIDHDSCQGNPRRIFLPFVSKGATWIDPNEDEEEEEDSDNLVVSITPPHVITSDSLLICYTDGLQPCFENMDDYDGLFCEEATDEVEYEEAYV